MMGIGQKSAAFAGMSLDKDNAIIRVLLATILDAQATDFFK
jgi:hypothetical protein